MEKLSPLYFYLRVCTAICPVNKALNRLHCDLCTGASDWNLLTLHKDCIQELKNLLNIVLFAVFKYYQLH